MIYLFLLGMFCIETDAWSQDWAKKGQLQFEQLAYSDAIISFEKAIRKGNREPLNYALLAESYYHNANYDYAAKYYRLFFNSSSSKLQKHYFQYGQSLKSIGKYEEANAILKKMITVFAENESYISSYTAEKDFKKNPNKESRYSIQLAWFNSKVADFAPALLGKQIVFSSTRDTSGIFKKQHSWTNQSFSNLFIVNHDSTEIEPRLLDKKLKSDFNQSTAVFTKDGTTMYFTKNIQNERKGTKNSNQNFFLSIYKAEKKNGIWREVGVLPFCDNTFNTAHPALSPDEKTLYFSSDRPGSFGLTDLYKVTLLENGAYGTPENLGNKINTMGRDTFPFVTQDNNLYFASDGHDTFGGLDLFFSNRDFDGTWRKPQNCGEPLNSRSDDFGLSINTESKEGYFSSNRPGGIGLDDIYIVKELWPLPCSTQIRGAIAVNESNPSIRNIEVILTDNLGNFISKTLTDVNGNYYFDVNCNASYQIEVAVSGFLPQKQALKVQSFSVTEAKKMILEKERFNFKIGDDLAKKLSLLPIYFDLGKWSIRPDAAAELAKIKMVLNEYPNLSIEIRSHTDSRDTAENNQVLSEKRAVATQNWLITNGIESTRISSRGFGESSLLNSCVDAVQCTEAEHQLNRRSEFIVTDL